MIDTADKQIYTAGNLLKEGKIEASLQELNLLLARQPESGKGQALLGHIQFRYFNDFANAEEAFRKAMRVVPNHAELYYDYSEMLLQLERYTETVAVLNKAMEVPGIEKDKIYRLFGFLNERQGKYDDAIEYFSKAILYTFSLTAFSHYEDDVERCVKKKGRV